MPGRKAEFFLIIIIGTTCLLVGLTFVAYFLNFSTYTVSDSPEHWGQFGDFVGGILNPVVYGVNLIVLIFITLLVNDLGQKNAEKTLHESVRPIGFLSWRADERNGLIEVSLENLGFGPLVVMGIRIEDAATGEVLDNNLHDFLTENMPHFVSNLDILECIQGEDGFVLGRDHTVFLFRAKVKPSPANKNHFGETRSILLEKLRGLRTVVAYTDMYSSRSENISTDFKNLGSLSHGKIARSHESV